MYIYELPFDVNKELCRMLDCDDNWKELAGVYMKFSAFDINCSKMQCTEKTVFITELRIDVHNQLCRLLDQDDYWKRLAEVMKFKAFDIVEMERNANFNRSSPTAELFTHWGQQNHKVEELFVLLYKMQHMPALHCLRNTVGDRYLRLLNRNGSKNGVKKDSVDENGNKANSSSKGGASQAFIPRPVVELELGVQPPSSSGVCNGHSPTDSTRDSTSDMSSSQDSRSHSHTAEVNDDIIKQVSAIPLLKYEELREATNNWHESNLLGQGGFGQVYKGEWKLLTVAVKRLKNDGKNRELIREMCLNQYRHDNILPLYGYSLGGSEACLVYQLMTGGSLEQRLRCKSHQPPLTWSQRHRIAHGVARGLQFLHTMTGTPLIHGDIKPANILLDQCGAPKIGDFGLARKGPYGEDRTHLKVSKVHGTRPYLPDEYIRSRCLSPAVDVFSYGVVLLEIATALPSLDRARAAPLLSDHIHLLARDGNDLAQLEDRTLVSSGQSSAPLTREFVRIGVLCTAPARRLRPAMMHVYKRLDAMAFPGRDTS